METNCELRLYKSNSIAEDYVKINMERSHRCIIAKFSSGSLPLQIETGRCKKPKVPLNNRICNLCNDNDNRMKSISFYLMIFTLISEGLY